MLRNDIRNTFKQMKQEQRPKKIYKTMVAQRALLFDLKEANESTDKADEMIDAENSMQAQNQLNAHQRHVYKIVRDVYYTEQHPIDFLNIDTELEPAKITRLRKENPEQFQALRKKKAETLMWKLNYGQQRLIKTSRVPEELLDYIKREITENSSVPDHIASTYAQVFGLQVLNRHSLSMNQISIKNLMTEYNCDIRGKLP